MVIVYYKCIIFVKEKINILYYSLLLLHYVVFIRNNVVRLQNHAFNVDTNSSRPKKTLVRLTSGIINFLDVLFGGTNGK